MNEFNTDLTKKFGAKEKDALKPVQHPSNLHSEDTSIISHKVPPKNLTPYDHVPVSALTQFNLPCLESPMGARSHSVSLLGAPNAGKSSLFNQIVQKNISAVSNKQNTTDETTEGVYTDIEAKTQLII